MPPKHVSPQACIALIAPAIGFIVLTLGALRLPPGAIERAIED